MVEIEGDLEDPAAVRPASNFAANPHRKLLYIAALVVSVCALVAVIPFYQDSMQVFYSYIP